MIFTENKPKDNKNGNGLIKSQSVPISTKLHSQSHIKALICHYVENVDRSPTKGKITVYLSVKGMFFIFLFKVRVNLLYH